MTKRVTSPVCVPFGHLSLRFHASLPPRLLLSALPMASEASKWALACKWLPEHIEKMLESLEENKASLGQGRNPTKTYFQDAATAINKAFEGLQNKDKAPNNVSDKWKTVCGSIYIPSIVLIRSSSALFISGLLPGIGRVAYPMTTPSLGAGLHLLLRLFGMHTLLNTRWLACIPISHGYGFQRCRLSVTPLSRPRVRTCLHHITRLLQASRGYLFSDLCLLVLLICL